MSTRDTQNARLIRPGRKGLRRGEKQQSGLSHGSPCVSRGGEMNLGVGRVSAFQKIELTPTSSLAVRGERPQYEYKYFLRRGSGGKSRRGGEAPAPRDYSKKYCRESLERTSTVNGGGKGHISRGVVLVREEGGDDGGSLGEDGQVTLFRTNSKGAPLRFGEAGVGRFTRGGVLKHMPREPGTEGFAFVSQSCGGFTSRRGKRSTVLPPLEMTFSP